MTVDAIAVVARLVAAVAVILLVTSLGLGVTAAQVRSVLSRPGLLMRSVVAELVLVPLVALLAALALGVERRAVIGIVLMGVSPAAPLVMSRARQATGDRDFAPGLQVALALLAIASVPGSLALLSRLFPGAHAWVSPWDVASQVGRVQLLPLAAGMAVRALRPALADRLERPLARLAMLLLLLFVGAALALRGPDLLRIGPRAYAAMAVAVAASIALGHLLGGPAAETRTIVAVASALRNPGLALLVVQLNFPGLGIGAVLLAYVLVTFAFLTAFVAWRRRRRRVPQPEGDPAEGPPRDDLPG
jgi:predicted Na+-dependent transporter